MSECKCDLPASRAGYGEWVLYKDRKPNNRQKVRIYGESGNFVIDEIAIYYNDPIFIGCNGEWNIEPQHISHWQSVPDAP